MPRRIQLARENGFLNARCRKGHELLRVYGLWCWRMGIPLVWYERRSPHSRFSRVHLEMLTTNCTVTVAGRAALIATATPPGDVSAHGAVWDRVPAGDAADFARAVFRTVRRRGNQQVQQNHSGLRLVGQALSPAKPLCLPHGNPLTIWPGTQTLGRPWSTAGWQAEAPAPPINRVNLG